MNINFLKTANIFLLLSTLLVVVILVMLALKGFRYGTDFTGGIELTVEFSQPVEVDSFRVKLTEAGFVPDLEKIVSRENTFKVRHLLIEDDPSITEDRFKKFFSTTYPASALEEVHIVGGLLSSQNKSSSILISLVVILCIVAYLALRFNISYSLAAIVAVLHDMVLMIGAVLLFDTEMSVLVIVAILTIFGYSVNDSIVLFDRIREKKNSKEVYEDYKTLLNTSINSVFSRTIITTITTFVVVLSLFLSTEGGYRDFAEILLVGIISGTYSSIYVACGFLVLWDKKKSLLKFSK